MKIQIVDMVNRTTQSLYILFRFTFEVRLLCNHFL